VKKVRELFETVPKEMLYFGLGAAQVAGMFLLAYFKPDIPWGGFAGALAVVNGALYGGAGIKRFAEKRKV